MKSSFAQSIRVICYLVIPIGTVYLIQLLFCLVGSATSVKELGLGMADLLFDMFAILMTFGIPSLFLFFLPALIVLSLNPTTATDALVRGQAFKRNVRILAFLILMGVVLAALLQGVLALFLSGG